MKLQKLFSCNPLAIQKSFIENRDPSTLISCWLYQIEGPIQQQHLDVLTAYAVQGDHLDILDNFLSYDQQKLSIEGYTNALYCALAHDSILSIAKLLEHSRERPLDRDIFRKALEWIKEEPFDEAANREISIQLIEDYLSRLES